MRPSRGGLYRLNKLFFSQTIAYIFLHVLDRYYQLKEKI